MYISRLILNFSSTYKALIALITLLATYRLILNFTNVITYNNCLSYQQNFQTFILQIFPNILHNTSFPAITQLERSSFRNRNRHGTIPRVEFHRPLSRELSEKRDARARSSVIASRASRVCFSRNFSRRPATSSRQLRWQIEQWIEVSSSPGVQRASQKTSRVESGRQLQPCHPLRSWFNATRLATILPRPKSRSIPGEEPSTVDCDSRESGYSDDELFRRQLSFCLLLVIARITWR